MENQEILTDDYVAKMLAADAKASSIRYSAMGLEAFTQPSKPPANKPKPNTRFLRNIIKDTDSHNAALLAKEAADAKARLQGLSSNEYREQKASHIGGGEIRRRQLGAIASILGGRPAKRSRVEEPKRDHKESRRMNNSSGDEAPPVLRVHDEKSRSRRQFGEISAILGSQTTKRKRAGDSNEKSSNRIDPPDEYKALDRKDVKASSRGRQDKGGIRSRSRGDDSEEDERDHERNRKRRRGGPDVREKDDDRRRRHRGNSEERRERHGQRSRSRSPKERHSRDSKRRDKSPPQNGSMSASIESDRKSTHRTHRRRSRSTESRMLPEKRSSTKGLPKENYDSDPLDDIIGPRPPPPATEIRIRGRGTVSHGSGIDSRFAASYDPTADVQLDPDEDNDWDQALEALRDRQKWKQQGADRLRAAGFTADEISKWEKGGEKREEDVKWTKKGESREWDRGKVVDTDGDVTLEADWGRLK